MKIQKYLPIIVVIILLLVTGISCFYLGRYSIKKSLEKTNSSISQETENNSPKTYNLNETIKTNLFEICFKDISFNDTICTYQYHHTETGHEEFLKSIQTYDIAEDSGDFPMIYHESNKNSYIISHERNASDKMTLVTIEYTIKNISQNMIDLSQYESFSKFSLIYDKDYNFVDNTTSNSNSNIMFVEAQTTNANTQETYNIWNNVNMTSHPLKLNPLSDEVRVRECIMTSDVIKNEEKSLVLLKQVRNTALQVNENDSLYIKIR